jgi:hypothetical protein
MVLDGKDIITTAVTGSGSDVLVRLGLKAAALAWLLQKIWDLESLQETTRLGKLRRPHVAILGQIGHACLCLILNPILSLFTATLTFGTIRYPICTLFLVNNFLLNHKTLSFPSKTQPVIILLPIQPSSTGG